MDFGTDYWHAMDKDKVEKIAISPREIGLSSGIGDPWFNLQTHIKAGASHVELGFMGTGKGSIGSPTGFTPESVSKEKREDIRQLAKLNNVTLSTHASANVMGFAGLNPKEGKFSDQAAEEGVKEVKRAIDFAAETAGGGPVVIHTGEFPRSITEAEKIKITEKGKEKEVPLFEAYKKEAEEGPIYLVNKKTGKIEIGIARNTEIPTKPKTDKKGNFIFNEKGELEFEEKYNFAKYQDKHGKEIHESGLPAEEYFYQQMVKEEKLRENAELGKWRENLESARRQKEDLEEEQEKLYKDAKEKHEPTARFEAMKIIRSANMMPREGTPEFQKLKEDPIRYLDRVKEKVGHEIKYAESGVEGHARKLEQIKEQEGQVKSMKGYAIERSAQNMAKLGLYAYEVEKKKNLKNPLFIAPENVFPEQYGSHPQELKHIVMAARKQMEDQLMAKKVERKEAEKIAADHIKATFDIGHANTWKKYFKGSDEDFKKWLLKEAKQLQKEGIIGNVHLADNFGYEDEHLTPGQGNAPIEEFLKEIKEEGYEGKFVVEPGAQTEQEGGIYTAMTGAWGKLANSPMYRTGKFAESWTDISGGYLSHTGSTRYVQGTYLPSKEIWGWYSETPIE